MEELALTPYLERSRGGRGYHVWVLFAEPGVPVGDLHLVLSTLVSRLPDVDVFPSGPGGRGRALFLPYFGGRPLLDGDLHPVAPETIEPDDPDIITTLAAEERARRGATWPPPYWRTARDRTEAFDDPKFYRGPDGLLHARRGARNKLAGSTAKLILRRGGSFAEFAAWDAGNKPPLATDEPRALRDWCNGRSGRSSAASCDAASTCDLERRRGGAIDECCRHHRACCPRPADDFSTRQRPSAAGPFCCFSGPIETLGVFNCSSWLRKPYWTCSDAKWLRGARSRLRWIWFSDEAPTSRAAQSVPARSTRRRGDVAVER
jgi:hypothetical protein